METVELGRTGRLITRVGFGGCPLGGHGWGASDDQLAIQAVERACAAGVNFFDTADCYGLGKSERLLSETLGPRRHDLMIASKFGVCWDGAGKTWLDVSPQRMEEALAASLKRLRLDCLPLYYVHWPDGKTPVAETIAALDRCRRSGLIGAIGVSNFSPEQLRQACEVAEIAAVQVQYSLVDRPLAEALLPLALKHRVSVITWGSLAQGLLSGKFTADSKFGADDRRHRYANFMGDKFAENLEMVEQVRAIANSVNRTPAQVAIRWLLDTPGVGCVLFGAKRAEQVDDNIGGAGWHLPVSAYLTLEGRRRLAAA